APAVTVRLFDMNNNPATNDNSTVVTIAILANPGGGTLSGTIMRTAVAGVATFNDLSINKVGTGYTLQGTAAGLTATGASSAFTITPGAAAKLTFVNSHQPANT